MDRRLRFWQRIGLLVALAAVALATVTIVTLVLGRRSQVELAGIETRYVPLIELDRDLKTMFAETARALEDAAASADESRLADADRLDEKLRARIAAGAKTITSNGADAEVLAHEYGTYYGSARDVSAAIVAGTPITQLGAQIEAMHRTKQVFATRLEAATAPNRARLEAAFATARDSQSNALKIEIAVAIGAIFSMLLVSWWITRRTVKALRDVSIGVERLARGEFGEEIPVTGNDEITDLARQANSTAARLREYRERSDELLAETRRQAEAAENATRELEAFSYSVAHDLRAPLRGINGFSAALIEDVGESLPAEAKDHLARIRAAAVRMGELIDALLSLSRVSRSELVRKPVSLTQIANDVMTALQTADPSRQVRWIVEEGVTASGDAGLLRAMFDNLLGNAWKFVAKREGAEIEFGRSRGEPNTYFIRDNGAGFDMEYAGKLFAPFQRLHAQAEYAGTGIGLATVQRIVRRHGGTIRAEAAVGKGATFYFTLANPDAS